MTRETIEIEKKYFDHLSGIQYAMAAAWTKKFGLLAYGTASFCIGGAICSVITYCVMT
jgi:hypothetical protein|tara:strand:- start:191 stop:364 length:174 start_codon:yes stop_codon:yes gene_type:complete